MITSKQLKQMVAAAEEKAAALAVPINIAIVDAGAHLQVFVRMDAALIGSIDIAIKKAKTAVLFGVPSEAVWEYCKPGAPAHGLEHTNGGLAPFAGGLPLKASNGELLGAVGVSGGAVTQDLEIARAAVAGAEL